ncbi:unnamed protein product [Heterosigma akashiwo]
MMMMGTTTESFWTWQAAGVCIYFVAVFLMKSIDEDNGYGSKKTDHCSSAKEAYHDDDADEFQSATSQGINHVTAESHPHLRDELSRIRLHHIVQDEMRKTQWQ